MTPDVANDIIELVVEVDGYELNMAAILRYLQLGILDYALTHVRRIVRAEAVHLAVSIIVLVVHVAEVNL